MIIQVHAHIYTHKKKKYKNKNIDKLNYFSGGAGN